MRLAIIAALALSACGSPEPLKVSKLETYTSYGLCQQMAEIRVIIDHRERDIVLRNELPRWNAYIDGLAGEIVRRGQITPTEAEFITRGEFDPSLSTEAVKCLDAPIRS